MDKSQKSKSSRSKSSKRSLSPSREDERKAKSPRRQEPDERYRARSPTRKHRAVTPPPRSRDDSKSSRRHRSSRGKNNLQMDKSQKSKSSRSKSSKRSLSPSREDERKAKSPRRQEPDERYRARSPTRKHRAVTPPPRSRDDSKSSRRHRSSRGKNNLQMDKSQKSKSSRSKSSKRSLSSSREDERKAKSPRRQEPDQNTSATRSSKMSFYIMMSLGPVRSWREDKRDRYAFVTAEKILYGLIRDITMKLVADFVCDEADNDIIESDDSLEEIEDSSSSGSSSSSILSGRSRMMISSHERKIDRRIQEIIAELKRERRKWLKKDLFSHPLHEKMALFFAKEDNGGLTKEELISLIKINDYSGDPLIVPENPLVIKEYLAFLNESIRERVSPELASAFEKLLNVKTFLEFLRMIEILNQLCHNKSASVDDLRAELSAMPPSQRRQLVVQVVRLV